MTSFKSVLSACGLVTLLWSVTACDATRDINEKLVQTDKETAAALDSFNSPKANSSPLTISKRPWFGSQAVSISSGLALPAEMLNSDSITLTFDQPLTLRQTANLIQSVTGIRVIVNEKAAVVVNTGGNTDVKSQGFMPINGREVRGSKVIWQGALDDLLDQVADNFDAGWSYDGSNITIDGEVTKTFMLNALSTVVSDTSKVQSGGSGSTGAASTLPTVTTSGTTELKVWDEVKTVVDSIVSGHGRATYSPSTGTITVSGTPSAVRRIEDYLRFQNQLRLRRIAISVKVLQLTLSENVTTGLSSQQVVERILNDAGFSISTGTEGLTAGFVAADTVAGADLQPDLQSVLTASKVVTRASVTHSGSVVTLSDQPAPLQIGRQFSYLARRSSTAGTDTSGSSETLEPGTLDLGLTMNVLPRVVEDNRVVLRINLALTDSDTNNIRTFGGESEQIELPEVQTTGFQQNTVLRSGETLVLAGFEKDQNSINDEGIPGFDAWIGGEKNRLKRREVTVMLINASILPEDPMTVYSNNK